MYTVDQGHVGVTQQLSALRDLGLGLHFTIFLPLRIQGAADAIPMQ